MKFGRIRLWMAGLVAFAMGFPLSEEAMAGDTFDIITSSFDLGLAIADSIGGS